SLLIGISGSLIIFFTLVPIAYSFRSIPLKILRNYIFKHRSTLIYFSLQLSYLLLMGFFSIFNDLPNIDIIICISLFIASISTSIIYFFWFTKILNYENIIRTIINKIDFIGLEEFEETISNEKSEFNAQIENNRSFLVSDEEDFFLSLTRNQYSILDDREGLLKKIHLNEIIRILNDENIKFNKLKLNVKIGDSLPKPEYYSIPGITPTYKIITLYFNSEKDLQSSLFAIKKKENNLKSCFLINKDEDKFGYYKSIIDDIFLCIEKVLPSDDLLFKIILENLESLIYKEYFNDSKEWDIKTSIKQDIFKYTLDRLIDLSRNGLTNIQFKSIIKFLYHVNSLSIKNKSLLLAKSVLNFTDILFFKVFTLTTGYNPSIASYILNIHELTFRSGISNIVESENDEDFNKSFQNLYEPIIYTGIRSAVLSYSYIVEYFYIRHPIESKKYLTINGQYLVDFLTPLYHWRTNDTDDRKWKIEISKYLGKYLVYLSILIFKEIESDNLPKSLLFDIAFPLSNECNNFSKMYNIKSIQFLDEFFYSHSFNYPTDYPESRWFESPIHEASTYTPSFYGFYKYWLALSIYRKLNNESFIPSKLFDKTYELEWFKKYLDSLNHNELLKIRDLINIDREKIEKIFEEYKIHVNNLLNNQNLA
ncbi:MAG: hypothetical protein ACTSRP_26505, partial [Candidatus Helarchaeota archaeon]